MNRSLILIYGVLSYAVGMGGLVFFILFVGGWGVIVGLRRRGFDRPVISALRAAYLTFFEGQGTRRERIAAVRAAHPELAEVGDLADFIEGCGDAPLVLPRKALSGGGPVDPPQP